MGNLAVRHFTLGRSLPPLSALGLQLEKDDLLSQMMPPFLRDLYAGAPHNVRLQPLHITLNYLNFHFPHASTASFHFHSDGLSRQGSHSRS